MSGDNQGHPPDRLWWGVLCGAAGSLVTTILFVAFLAFGGHLKITMPTLFAPGAHVGAAPIEPKGKLLFTLTGSNTIGSALAPELVRSFLLSQRYSNVSIGPVSGSATHVDTVVEALDPDGAPAYVLLHAPGSKAAPAALAAGEAEIGMMSTPLNFEDASQMQGGVAERLKSRFGEDARRRLEHVIALDGVNVVVNRDNSVSDMSRSELASVFGGAVLRWKQLGRDRDGGIALVRRDDKSGTTETMLSYVMRPGGQSAFAPTARSETSSDAVVAFVRQNPDAIGFVGMGFPNGSIKTLKVRDQLHSAALAPEDALIKLEAYPLSRRLYLYAAPGNPMVDKFIQFVGSPAADEAIRTANFINLGLEQIASDRAMRLAHSQMDGSPDARAYFDRLAGANRLTANVMFDGDQLDRRASDDIGRLAVYLSDHHIDASKLVFVRVAEARDADQDGAQRDIEAVRSAFAAAAQGGKTLSPEQFIAVSAPQPGADAIAPAHPGRHVEIWLKA
jgi:phosphate transport system substrate-binding protein